jgi:hypothetical protein
VIRDQLAVQEHKDQLDLKAQLEMLDLQDQLVSLDHRVRGDNQECGVTKDLSETLEILVGRALLAEREQRVQLDSVEQQEHLVT